MHDTAGIEKPLASVRQKRRVLSKRRWGILPRHRGLECSYPKSVWLLIPTQSVKVPLHIPPSVPSISP